MRVAILALSVFGILASVNVATAGPSTADRDRLASADPAINAQQSNQQTEDQIGLDKARRRDVQRALTRLGLDTKVNGRFDEPTRAVITRWQAARGYPTTGFLNTQQHQALLTESAPAPQASAADTSDGNQPARRSGGGGAHHHRSGGGGPGGLIGGVVGGLFGRR